MTTTTANRPQMPLFASAPRVEIYMGGEKIAFAIGINFNLSVDVQPVYAFGQYGPVSLEPTFYNLVTGTVQIIRLANAANRKKSGENSQSLNKMDGLATPKHIGSPASEAAGSANSVLSKSGLSMHLHPDKVLVSSLFDLVVYLKVPTLDTAKEVAGGDAAKIQLLAAKTSKADIDALSELKPWIAIRGCRLNARNVNVTMGQIVNEPVSFTGLYADPHSNESTPSGMFNTDEQTKDS